MNKNQRAIVIDDFITMFMYTEGHMIGGVKGNHSLDEVEMVLRGMRSQGRSQRWTDGVDQAVDVISKAQDLFADAMDSPRQYSRSYKREELGPYAKEDFDRLMVWAVLQSSTYLTLANA